MTNTLPSAFTTISEVYAYIREAIEASGAASADEFDVAAIADEVATWHDGRDEDGTTHLNEQYFMITDDTAAFWAAVEANAL